ncbi:anti-sigma regulatory factor [Iodobacter ciconiae]|uniref:Anti-sigma regulatory factor n=1 Tax=Iodobacter ciconiae TaxID=2496266 RepID=A0A3S8ZSG9_9NEIS|nr:anti-sigma regulatory factor [Iodobacter ciconiae]AZN36450.1 anti-sigma regulatory factor [Iodobacter ciconiae]
MKPSVEMATVWRKICNDADVAMLVAYTFSLAKQCGYSPVAVTEITTGASELATNIVKYAGEGMMSFSWVVAKGREGLEVKAEDRGPGIKSLDLAMSEHYSTKGTLGLGLPGTRRLADEFEISSEPEMGTCVLFRKWKN